MSSMLRLVLVFHNHQPIGNFDGVFEQAYQDSYRPFLEVFERSPGLPIALHTSGALSAEVLGPLREKGWHTGSIHPLISVTDRTEGGLEGAVWSVEGDNAALRVAKSIVRDLGGKSFSIRSEDKPLYHAAAVMASGNVVALFDVALEMLGR